MERFATVFGSWGEVAQCAFCCAALFAPVWALSIVVYGVSVLFRGWPPAEPDSAGGE